MSIDPAVVWRWEATPPNLLPVNETTGGRGNGAGWTGGTQVPGDQAVTVPAGATAGAYNLDTGRGMVPVTPGQTYTAAATADRAGRVGVAWYSSDGTRIDPVWSSTGAGRLVVTAAAPPGAVGAEMLLSAGANDVVFRDLVLVQSVGDPGPLNPRPVNPLTGDRWYTALPECYRVADRRDKSTAKGQPLKAFLDAVGSTLDPIMYLADRIEAGQLTDPDTADVSWLPWLAQTVGVTPRQDTAETRALIASRLVAAQPGTPAAVIALARMWLQGTSICNLVPAQAAWTLQLRIRGDELKPGITTGMIETQLLASGLLPVGYTVKVVTGMATWQAVDALGPWQAVDDKGDWQTVESTGVSGV